mgnify:CR=1 FL=1
MEYDAVIIGAGPAGLSAACKLKQLNSELSVCVVEKSAEVGGHILSGAVIEPRALNELFPSWKELGAPIFTKVSGDEIFLLSSATGSKRIPSILTPKTMHNEGNYIVSLGNLCRWLCEQAEALGVEVFPGFSAADILFGNNNTVLGIITGDMGVTADGAQKDSFLQGMELRGKYTLFAEGSRGHLGQKLIAHYSLDSGKCPQHYGLGVKELWKVPQSQHQAGRVIHTAGWPLSESDSSGGGFLYHLEDQQVAVGFISDLSYSNPYVDPFEEFQRYKHHPVIARHLTGGERIAYGARAITKGGIQSLPEMVFPGGIMIGDDAGTLNFAKIKGTHTAMKSAMVAAETVATAIANGQQNESLAAYPKAFTQSWAYKELYAQRNFGPAQHRWGNFWGSAYAFLDINIFNGCLPWTLKDKTPDHQQLIKAAQSKKIEYPKHDNILSFDRLSSVYLSNTNHEEDQPCHLQLLNAKLPLSYNLPEFDEPAQRYCPAGVYEVIENDSGEPQFQINAQNCVHCKTCDIKDPEQNIQWQPPEGGGGPNYPNM